MGVQRATLRHKIQGAHVLCVVFLNGARCGELIMEAGEEFEMFRTALMEMYGRNYAEEQA